MKKPEISPNFTIDDIHKIREYNSALTKDMTPAERTAYYSNKADAVLKKFGIVPKRVIQ